MVVQFLPTMIDGIVDISKKINRQSKPILKKLMKKMNCCNQDN